MESIHELREQLQSEKVNRQAWGYRYLRRGLSIYVTSLLLRTNIRPNQVTVAMVLVGMAGAVAIFFGYIWLGFLLIYLNIVLDAVDGELARYKKVFSLRGVYMDRINHLAVPGFFFLAVTFWVLGAEFNPHEPLFVLGVLGAFALPLSLVAGDIHRQIFVRPYLEHPELYPLPVHSKETAEITRSSPSLLRGVATAVFQASQFVVIVIVLFLAYLAELVFFSDASYHPVLVWAVAAYAALFMFYLVRRIMQGFAHVEDQVAMIADTLNANGRSS